MDMQEPSSPQTSEHTHLQRPRTSYDEVYEICISAINSSTQCNRNILLGKAIHTNTEAILQHNLELSPISQLAHSF